MAPGTGRSRTSRNPLPALAAAAPRRGRHAEGGSARGFSLPGAAEQVRPSSRRGRGRERAACRRPAASRGEGRGGTWGAAGLPPRPAPAPSSLPAPRPGCAVNIRGPRVTGACPRHLATGIWQAGRDVLGGGVSPPRSSVSPAAFSDIAAAHRPQSGGFACVSLPRFGFLLENNFGGGQGRCQMLCFWNPNSSSALRGHYF